VLRPDLTLQLDLQYVYNQYRLYDEKFVNTDFSVPYHFLNPRAGLNYNVTEKVNVYAQISRTSREPRLKNLYDAAEASTPALWGAVTPQFKTLPNGTFDFSDPLVKPEALLDLELGGGYISDQLRAGVNFFSMMFSNEIIKKGQLDRFGIPVTGNAEKTLHQGIEFTGAARLNDLFEFQANATLSRNRLKRYTVYSNTSSISLDGNAIAGFPDVLGNLRATYRNEWLSVSLSLQHVGEFYTDNNQKTLNALFALFGRRQGPDPGRTVDAYTVVHAWLSVKLPTTSLARNLEFQVQVNNLFNRIYASHGEGDEFYPAAERNIFASLRLGL
jgi:iron complex outermembrane receptor protein